MEPYVIGILPRYVEIRTISPRVLIQSIELSKPRYITQGKHMYVASTSCVWRLIPVAIPMQIQQLLQDKQFSLALMLAVSQCYSISYNNDYCTSVWNEAQLVEHCTVITEIWVWIPVQACFLASAEVLLNSCTAITKGKTPVPVCSPKLSPVGQGWYLDGWPSG